MTISAPAYRRAGFSVMRDRENVVGCYWTIHIQ
jgi:uncharacterized protein YkwD